MPYQFFTQLITLLITSFVSLQPISSSNKKLKWQIIHHKLLAQDTEILIEIALQNKIYSDLWNLTCYHLFGTFNSLLFQTIFYVIHSHRLTYINPLYMYNNFIQGQETS